MANASALAAGKMPTRLDTRYEDIGRVGGLPGNAQGARAAQQGGWDAWRPVGSGGWATFSSAAPLAPALFGHIASRLLSKRRREAAHDDRFGQVKQFERCL